MCTNLCATFANNDTLAAQNKPLFDINLRRLYRIQIYLFYFYCYRLSAMRTNYRSVAFGRFIKKSRDRHI